MTDLISDLQARLQQQADPKTRTWWENYLKGVIPFRGVKMGVVRKVVHAWVRDHRLLDSHTPAELKELAHDLIRQAHTEDKLAGILMIQEVLLPGGCLTCADDLPALAVLFEDGFIYDWNTCDWFCVKVLGPLAEQQGEGCARKIAAWKDGSTLWQRRAAGVAFVNYAARGEANFPGFTDMLLAVCSSTVRDPARFAQTGTGWVLRELSVGEPARVQDFVESNLASFSREGLRYAIAKLSNETQQKLLHAHRASSVTSRPASG